MKKFAKLLALLMVLVLALAVFVACNGGGGEVDDDDDEGGEEGGEQGGGSSSASGKVTVNFIVKDLNGVEIDRITYEVKKGKDVYAPSTSKYADKNFVITGWDSDGDETADTKYAKPRQDYDVVALIRAKETFTIEFYEMDGTTLIESITALEGSAITEERRAAIEYSVVVGKIFDSWTGFGDEIVDLNAVNCSGKYKATYRNADGTIPFVTGIITVDGNEKEADGSNPYENAALLPVDALRHSMNENNLYEERFPNGELKAQITSVVENETIVGTYGKLIWGKAPVDAPEEFKDCKYIYLLISVDDKTPVARSQMYLNNVSDAYLNDAADIFYTFQQGAVDEKNNVKVGVAGINDQKNMLKFTTPLNAPGSPRSRSTWFEGIVSANTNYAVAGSGLFAKPGKGQHSYRVEVAFPAMTEGVPGDGCNEIGLKPGASPDSKNPNDYLFVGGTELKAGDCVRFTLQINDLQLDQASLYDKNSDIQEAPKSIVWKEGDTVGPKTWLVDKDGNGLGYSTIFTNSGRTQHATKYYIAFSLNSENVGMTKIYGFDKSGNAVDKYNSASGEDVREYNERIAE